MTIYTAKQNEKNEQKSKLIQEGFTEIPTETKEPVPDPKIVITAQRKRTSACASLCVIFTSLVVLGIGIVGGIFLYNHLAHRTFKGWCAVRYYEFQEVKTSRVGHLKPQKHYGTLDEKVEIDKQQGKYERIEVPDVEDCHRATVLHDFEKNFTAIVDKGNERCFVMPLNQTAVKPPRDFWDLITKLNDGYYIPDTELVRENFRIIQPAVDNLVAYGFYIWKECRRYDTYSLKKIRRPGKGHGRLHKREAEASEFCVQVWEGVMTRKLCFD